MFSIELGPRDIAAGTLIVDEAPIVVLDPPTKRKDLLMLLGCRLFSTIDMRTTPDNIRWERDFEWSTALIALRLKEEEELRL